MRKTTKKLPRWSVSGQISLRGISPNTQQYDVQCNDDVSVTAPSVTRMMKQRIRQALNAEGMGKLKRQNVLVRRNHGGGGECLGLYGKIKAKWAINKQWGCEMDSSGSWSLERDSRYVGFRKCRVFMKRMSNCQLLKVGSVLAFECCSNEKLQPTRYGTSDVAYFTSTSRHSQNSVCTIRP